MLVSSQTLFGNTAAGASVKNLPPAIQEVYYAFGTLADFWLTGFSQVMTTWELKDNGKDALTRFSFVMSMDPRILQPNSCYGTPY